MQHKRRETIQQKPEKTGCTAAKRKMLTALLLFVQAATLLFGVLPSARAEDAPERARGEESRFAGKSLEQVMDEFLTAHNISEYTAAIGYYNTVTGEEYYYNADRYMDAASMYKVPLNMVFAERVAKGELDPDGEIAGVSYPFLREETIVSSSNEWAAFLWEQLGGYNSFRRTIAPYMGEDPDTVSWKYYENNFFTPRQVIHCLELLYREKERFPEVIETMLKAEQESYFCRDERRFPIAHKYGYNIEDDVLHLNDCAIVYTDEPILLVCFTSAVSDAYSFLAEYCTLMCDYTEYRSAEKRAAELSSGATAAEGLPAGNPMPDAPFELPGAETREVIGMAAAPAQGVSASIPQEASSELPAGPLEENKKAAEENAVNDTFPEPNRGGLILAGLWVLVLILAACKGADCLRKKHRAAAGVFLILSAVSLLSLAYTVFTIVSHR